MHHPSIQQLHLQEEKVNTKSANSATRLVYSMPQRDSLRLIEGNATAYNCGDCVKVQLWLKRCTEAEVHCYNHPVGSISVPGQICLYITSRALETLGIVVLTQLRAYAAFEHAPSEGPVRDLFSPNTLHLWRLILERLHFTCKSHPKLAHSVRPETS